jgi:ABC-type phosphonate transport system ATPase subunit
VHLSDIKVDIGVDVAVNDKRLVRIEWGGVRRVGFLELDKAVTEGGGNVNDRIMGFGRC